MGDGLGPAAMPVKTDHPVAYAVSAALRTGTSAFLHKI
jgi:hypothetical protein